MPARILIGGYYGHGNAGDEALLAVVLRELRALRPDLQAIVASGDPERTRAAHGTEAVASTDLPALAAAIRESDLVLVGGGGLFQDYWEVPAETFLTPRQGGLYSYLLYPVLAALLGRPSMIYAAGVGPLTTDEGKRLTRVAFELSGPATVRDSRSLALLEEIGVTGALLAADPAFLFEPAPRAETAALLEELGIGSGEAVTGVALRHWDFGVEPALWEAEIAHGLDLHLANSPDPPGRLLFLPLQNEEGESRYEDDLAVARRVAGALQAPERAVVVDRHLSPEALAGLLGHCRRVLAMRFHAALFALSAGVPVAALAYDPKVTALMEEAGLAEQALPVASWRAEEVAAALRRAAVPVGLAAFVTEARERARRSAVLAVQALDSEAPARSEARRFLDETALAKAESVVRLETERDELRRRIVEGDSELSTLRQCQDEVEAALEVQKASLQAREAELHGEPGRAGRASPGAGDPEPRLARKGAQAGRGLGRPRGHARPARHDAAREERHGPPAGRARGDRGLPGRLPLLDADARSLSGRLPAACPLPGRTDRRGAPSGAEARCRHQPLRARGGGDAGGGRARSAGGPVAVRGVGAGEGRGERGGHLLGHPAPGERRAAAHPARPGAFPAWHPGRLLLLALVAQRVVHPGPAGGGDRAGAHRRRPGPAGHAGRGLRGDAGAGFEDRALRASPIRASSRSWPP